jgi:hypothetical protein
MDPEEPNLFTGGNTIGGVNAAVETLPHVLPADFIILEDADDRPTAPSWPPEVDAEIGRTGART